MRKKRLAQLAEWLENGAQHETIDFDMSTGITTILRKPYDPHAKEQNVCSTSCCIAGATTQFFATKRALQRLQFGYDAEFESNRIAISSWGDVRAEAIKLLDISPKAADMLFTPDSFYGGTLSDYNDPQWAARTIRHLIATGNVDWRATAILDPNHESHQSDLAREREEYAREREEYA